ncbi:unnamed protein product [Diabrotica balteata]|uniref:UBR-type domain-containing protein n=1 Tax=Diabrotica balteata TaxID=107213 RepID=A0A9N9T565_DIABA|nr:unnamed protein product [Diabrotica balteata]
MAWQITMAASSGGVDWTTVLKPFLSKNYETSNTAELIELCSAIVKSESEILRHKESNKNFFNSFAVLASDYISSSTSGLLASQLETVNAACRILLKYLLSALSTACSETNPSSAQIERYLNAIKVLCIGTGLLSTTEVTVLVDSMKGENLPQQNPVPSGNEKDVSNKQESSKNRSDLSVSIYEQLTLPLRDGRSVSLDTGASGPSTAPEVTPGSDPSSEINRLFLKANTESLQSLRAGDTLIDLCLSLPSIKKAKSKVEDALAGKPFCIPTNHAEATTLRNTLSSTLSDINLAMSAINLPVLEPLTSSKLDKLCSLAMAVLHCALSQAAAAAVLSMGSVVSPKCSNQQSQAGLKEDDLDSNAVALVEETLNMYNFIGNVIKTSTRAGGHVYQNYLLAGAWVLISGLQTHLTSSTSTEKSPHLREREEKGRSPCKSRDGNTARSGLQKFQQSFGVLSVALASRALSLLSELFDDLYLEVCGGAGSIVQVEPAPLAIMGQFTALQRISRILNAAPLNHLLFYLAIVSYRKACTLKRLHPPEGDTFSQSDSTTYYEDMIMCSDDSSTDEDDDSEPILGQWFEETLAPPETTESKSPTSENGETKTVQNERSRSMVPEKGEAHGFIALSTSVFEFLNKHFLCTKSTFISRYVKNGLTEQQMIILAAIIRDLDRETARTEIGTISVYFGQALGQLYCEFSGALTRFAHNLVTNGNLSNLQACLLNHLGVSPWNTDVPHAWPLQVYPRTLAVLAQVLLLRPQNEKEASVISIWHRLVNTLIENVLNNPHSVVESENEDLNVEHAQVLLYLFHSLNLMQKKSVVLLMAGGVLRCSEIARGPLKDSQLLHLSRVLLLFDYIMKHLYDPPTSLLEQIQWNLFYLTNLNSDKEKENTMTRMYTAWQDIEDNYRKISAVDEFAMKPRFYVLTNLEVNNQDAPKLDGLACNFILGTPDKLRYPLLLDALIEILNVTHITSGANASKISFLGLCATQYCFTICWRLLQLLPPSASYMERLATGENLTAGPLLLHSLVWGPRASHKNFSRWLKDCLVKQGMYTQHTDKLLKEVSEAVNNIKYNITNAKNCIMSLTPDVKKGMVTKENLPPLWHLFLLDALMTNVQVALEEPEGSTESTSITVSNGTYVQDLLPHVLRLTQAILHCTRWSLLHTIADQNPSCEKFSLQNFEGLQDVLAIASTKNTLTMSLSSELTTLLPSCVSSAQLQNYKTILEDVSLSAYQNDIIPSESAILKVVDAHVATLSMGSPYSINLSLRRLLQCLVKFICDHAPKTENTDTKNKAIELLVSITLDLRTEFLNDTVTKTLDKMIGDTEIDEHQKRVYLRVLDHTYKLITNYTSGNSETYSANIDEKILHHCLKFYEKIIEKSSGRQALEIFFTGDRDLVKVLMSVSSPQMSQHYGTRVLHFFNKLFQAAEKSSTDPSLNYLCSSMSKLANVDSEKLQTWLRQIIIGTSNIEPVVTTTVTINKEESPATSTNGKWTITTVESKEANSPTSNDDQKSLVQENSQLLQALTSFIVKQNSNVSEEVSITILKALIQLGKHLLSPTLEGTGFTDLMVDMIMLADAGSGKGHSYLFPATAEWIELCNKRISEKDVIEKLTSNPDSLKKNAMLEASSSILDYVSDVISTITAQHPQTIRPLSPPWESESPLELESEWQDFANDDDDSGEDSDEDSLCNKLCTFTVTQKEFMNQHWYHCHTCKMLDGVGVCSICARVCHKGHDLSYAKYGNFFCDCGAKEDGSCQALVKRSPQTNETNNAATGNNSEHMLTSSLRRKTSSPIPADKIIYKERKNSNTVKQLDGSKEFIVNYLGSSLVTGSLLEFLQSLIPAIEENCRRNSLVGCHLRGIKALDQLYSNEKKYVHTDQLMVPTLGSQEGAFENVRMSYAGEQGQTIRQLLSAHIVRRIAMCCMTSTQGRRQHLAVSHEKGKITVLQLSALLKQADSSTRKLTLTRLSTAPIPFTVLSLSSNLCNEDFLAVCGLKDCHVLTFTSGGSVCDHLVLHPQLETGNFIIKAIWLPGSQTKLALVTADFVKIYDLATDALSPQYYFLVPSGKIRDCTFMYDEGTYHILLMSSPGHIYTEILNDDSSTKYGSFYVTNTLEVFHLEAADVIGQVAGGGVSIYYSHTLGLLFYSYAQGKSFISPINPKSNSLPLVFAINLPQTNNTTSKSNGSKNSANQPLCQWTEIPNHPGLICCAMQSNNNPVILMLKPDTILIQEIRVVPAKSKIMDMVAIRHSSGNELRTTLILLCEDGSLKMYMANMDQTGFWMSSSIQANITNSSVKPKKKKVIKSGKTTNSVNFPVDFFEHCTILTEVEIGGNDLLQIYNQAQLKNRLNTTGLYVACNKPLGFSIEVTNNDPNIVMVGLRVLVGSQDVIRIPSFVEIFGRTIPITATRSRWYDIPFSREEGLQADKKLTILFGPSQDPETVTMVDSIKIYGKTKDSFGWPEESDENVAAGGTGSSQQAASNSDSDQSSGNKAQLTKLEKLVVGILESLDGSFSLHSTEDKLATFKSPTLKVATSLLTLPTQPSVQIHSKALLSSLHSTRVLYHNYKDQALLQHVLTTLTEMTSTNIKDLDAESYYRLVLIVRGIAVARPQNLVKFADSHTSIQDVVLEDPLENIIREKQGSTSKEIKPFERKQHSQHLLLQLMEVLWLLHSLNPEIPSLSLVVSQGLKHTEQIVHALVEIVHAFNSCDTYSNVTIAVYLQLLLCNDPLIAFSAKQALSIVLKPKTKRRKVFIPSPPHCVSPPLQKSTDDRSKTPPAVQQSVSHEEDLQSRHPNQYDVDAIEAIGLLEQPGQQQDNHNVNALEALLGGGVGFPPLLDIPPDADDEAMVELAIALSLQDHEIGGEQNQTLQSLQVQLGQELGPHQGQNAQAQESANFSDTTASAAGSDDEGSTAATDGSTLRTSPAEQAGSESGGSGVESITGEHNVSGRSSAYGDNMQEAINLVSRSDTSSIANTVAGMVEADAQHEEVELETESSSRLHVLRLQLLEKLVEYLPKLKNVDGVRVIPFLQVVLQLTADIDGHSERDRVCLNSLLTTIISELQLTNDNFADVCTRTTQREVQLILLRLLSVLMQRCKTSSTSTSSKTPIPDSTTFVSRTTATALHKADIINYCNKLLQALLSYWRNSTSEDDSVSITGNLLKERLPHPPPDMTPFFQRQFVKDNQDVFHTYPQLLTEIALRLPYQVHRHSDVSEPISAAFHVSWYKHLCDYMMTPQTPFVRRQVRKLLMFICGNKETYRQLRDLHGLRNHMKRVMECCTKAGYQPATDIQHALSLPYDALVELIEHLKYCVEVAQSRTGNWQRFCIKEEDVIQFLIRISFLLDDGVAPTVLQLLQSAIVVNSPAKKPDPSKTASRKDREKSDDSSTEAVFEESNSVILVEQITKHISKEVFARFINSLLEKADRVYKQLIANKPTLESLVLKITEHRPDKKEDAASTSSAPSAAGGAAAAAGAGAQLKVNKTIQMLAQQYCNECKTSFEELSKIIQKVLVSRKELVAYDRKHRDMELPKSTPVLSENLGNFPCVSNRCYGCSTAATEHCLTLLRALAHNPTTRQVLCSQGLIQELVWNNLRNGSIHSQEEVRQLLCVLTKDNRSATEELCNLLMERISLSLNGHISSADLGTSVRHEIALLAAMVQKEDDCWELKLRCMMNLFLKACEGSRSPLVMESIILPCLKILQSLMKVPEPGSKKTKEKPTPALQLSVQLESPYGAMVDLNKFLDKDDAHTFNGWKSRFPKTQEGSASAKLSKDENRKYYLAEKYWRKWRRHIKNLYIRDGLNFDDTSWLKAVIFNSSSRLARQVACNIIEIMCSSFERKRDMLDLLTHFLAELNTAGESSAEFLAIYQELIAETPWKQYLTVNGVLTVLAHLITIEIEQLHRLEETTLTSDLAQGYALNQITELLSYFLDDVAIRRQYKSRLVGAVLNGYLSLRRLVVQRTRLIDDTQEKLLELLEEMTTGTEEETKAFMSVCIQTVERYSLQDILTPVFIFERLCSIIYPEENDVGEFFLTLEKDPQQEDFLQGRMLGNPYCSLEAGLGPLMRDVKNKICQDCELVALLEDDNGMELLVNNKIMSLDLQVKDVYKKIWLAEGSDHEPMRIVYRMRGLLGDATEEFVESLSNKSQSDVDNEEVYKMANELADCGGLQVMVTRLGAIPSVTRARPLLQVLLKLFRLCVKVTRCQEVLIKPELKSMEVFLRTLQLCLDSDKDSSQTGVTEQLLDIMETILSKATSESEENFTEFSQTLGSAEYVKSLLSCTNQQVVKNSSVLVHLTRVLAALVYGNKEKMKILLDHFSSVLDFNKYDIEHNSDDQQKLEMFCVLTNSIEKNAIGSTLKDYIIALEIVKNALEYITMHAPCVKPTLLRVDSDELKDFISKPALKYILRFLTGLAHSHEKTQLAIAAAETIPIIHRLEQVSSDEHVGSLAENLLEALCTNPDVAKQIDAVRDFTRSEKKRLAMAMREKQLGQLGMRTNDKGQVTAKSNILQQIEELGEESGLVCCICREGYKYQPTKVLGLYTFTKRCNVEEFEGKPRKTVGYTTVSHFNIVHIDCHMSAVRLARARDEWESAALQNANTKCNGLLPLWGPQVPESSFASCLARHNTYLQESTNHRDIGHNSTIHDLKLLLLRFAQEKSFHEDTGGGGPQSNMHLIPYLIHVALYVINTTRVNKREEANLMSYIEATNPEKWIETAYDAEGPLYWITMSILLHSRQQWQAHRLSHFRRLMVLAHMRHCQPSGPVKTVSDKSVKDYNIYKPYLLFFGLIDGIYNHFFKNVGGPDEQWSTNLADYIRHNDEALMKSSEKLLADYTDEFLPCTSFSEFCDVAGLLDIITTPDRYLSDLLNGLP